MAAPGRDDGADGLDLRGEIEDLHATALRFVLLAVAALAVYAHFASAAFADRVDMTRFGLMWAVLLTAGLAYWATRFGVTPATAVLVSGLAAILGLAVLDARESALAYWFSPLVVVAGVLIGWRGSAALALIATAVLLVGRAEAG